MSERGIPFFRPDLTEREIQSVVEVLRSGWLTTGPKTKEFEESLAKYCGAARVLALNSATAGMELVLRLFDVGPGDEVITTPYTFAASANVILHVGATPVFVDVSDADFNLDPEKLAAAITPRTKAILPVDFGGYPVDYAKIRARVEERKSLFKPRAGTLQEKLDRPLILADSAHSFGAKVAGKPLGSQADFHVFSFHAVKNLTTGEGGAVAFRDVGEIPAAKVYEKLKLLSLHGQTKDALAKVILGGWRYGIELPGYKYNLTDLASAIGLVQLARYETEILPLRKRLFEIYTKALPHDLGLVFPTTKGPDRETSYHLYALRLPVESESARDVVIDALAKQEIAANVHFIPLPMHGLYARLGYSMDDYPVARRAYEREITLPLHAEMGEAEVLRVCEALASALKWK